VLIALYVTGLILLDGPQTQTRVSRFLPGRCHDALNRLSCGGNALFDPGADGAPDRLGQSVPRGGDGYLFLDDVVVEKAFAKRSWRGHSMDLLLLRQETQGLRSVHIVVLLCGAGRMARCASRRFPLVAAQTLVCAPHAPHTRPTRLADQTAHLWQRPCSRRSSAAWGSASPLHRLRHPLHCWVVHQGCGEARALVWVGTLDPRTIVVWRSRRQTVAELWPDRLPLKWRKRLGERAAAGSVYARLPTVPCGWS
jgi:hypothetical protein